METSALGWAGGEGGSGVLYYNSSHDKPDKNLPTFTELVSTLDAVSPMSHLSFSWVLLTGQQQRNTDEPQSFGQGAIGSERERQTRVCKLSGSK